MGIEDYLDEKRVRLIHSTILFSDIPIAKLPRFRQRVESAIVTHLESSTQVSDGSLYGISSRMVIRAEDRARNDALWKTVSLDAPLSTENSRTFLDLRTGAEEESPIDQQRIDSFNQAMHYLSVKLLPSEYSFLTKLIEADPTAVLENFVLSTSYVKENFPRIREMLQLVMKMRPELDQTPQTYRMDMESALEPHVGEIYTEIVVGTRRRLPREFLAEDKTTKGRILTKMLVEKVLGMRPSEAARIRGKDFIDKRLGGLLVTLYGNSSAEAVLDAYGNRFRRWEVCDHVSDNYWDGDGGRGRAQDATRWLLEEKLQWNPETGRKITARDFRSHHLGGMIEKVYDNSPTAAVMDAYPGGYQVWEIGEAPIHYWDGDEGKERAVSATKWLIEKRLRLELKDAVKVTHREFRMNNLWGMLQIVYNQSAKLAVVEAYPDKFKLIGKRKLEYCAGAN